MSEPTAFAMYDDGTYKYLGEAPAGEPLTSSGWRVSRITNATGRIQWAASGQPRKTFTDLATVAAFTYS